MVSRKPLKSWSYSTFSMWRRCPQRIYFSKIERLPDPLGPAVQRGIEVHELAEKFVKGLVKELPTKGAGKILIPFQSDLVDLMRQPTIQTEIDFTCTRDWKKTHWGDWGNAWVRAKLDFLYRPEKDHFVLGDFKTGQIRDYTQQIELYALCCFKAHKAAQKVTAELWMLDHSDADDAITSFEFDRKEEADLQAEWERRAKALMEDTEFRACPGNDCRFCPFSKLKSGPCEDG